MWMVSMDQRHRLSHSKKVCELKQPLWRMMLVIKMMMKMKKKKKKKKVMMKIMIKQNDQ